MFGKIKEEIVFSIKYNVKKLKYYKMLPVKQKNSDIYIVEFPKGGITWFSTIIANINLIESDSMQRATYYNIQQLIPDIHMNRNILDEPIWDVPKYRFIKSHYGFCPYYNQTIYLVRNPVSVMNSYYNYAIDRNLFEGTLEEFVKDENFGISSWKKHVESWLNKPKSQRMHIVKFEDLRNDTMDSMRNLYINLGINVSDESINKSVELANLVNMKKSESVYNLHDPSRKLKFVKEGKVQNKIPSAIREYIISETSDLLKILNYDEKLL